MSKSQSSSREPFVQPADLAVEVDVARAHEAEVDAREQALVPVVVGMRVVGADELLAVGERAEIGGDERERVAGEAEGRHHDARDLDGAVRAPPEHEGGDLGQAARAEAGLGDGDLLEARELADGARAEAHAREAIVERERDGARAAAGRRRRRRAPP